MRLHSFGLLGWFSNTIMMYVSPGVVGKKEEFFKCPKLSGEFDKKKIPCLSTAKESKLSALSLKSYQRLFVLYAMGNGIAIIALFMEFFINISAAYGIF